MKFQTNTDKLLKILAELTRIKKNLKSNSAVSFIDSAEKKIYLAIEEEHILNKLSPTS